MSTTPRTDKAEITMIRGYYSDGEPDEVLVVPSGEMAELETELQQANAQIAALRGALSFYADTSKYPAPLTGGMGDLWQDCGQIATKALSSPAPVVVPLAQYDELKTDAEALVGLLYLACFGSCTCETKTPELKHHSESCTYRRFSEAIESFRAKHPKQEKEGA